MRELEEAIAHLREARRLVLLAMPAVCGMPSAGAQLKMVDELLLNLAGDEEPVTVPSVKRHVAALVLVLLLPAAVCAQDFDKAKALSLAQQLVELMTGPPTVHVAAGGNLQAALDGAPDGATVFVDTTGLYDAPRPTKARSKPVTVQPDTQALPAGLRVGPSDRGSLIKLRPTQNNSSLVVPSGAQGYVFRGFWAAPGADASYTVVQCGDAKETDPARAAQHIVFDQWLVQGDPVKGGKHAFTLNCGDVAVTNSYVADFWFGDDSQAITGDNGPGPFLIENNYLEASGENILFGGASAMNQAMQPSHLTVRRNLLTKRLAWKGLAGHTVKNLFELKNMAVALVELNVMENCWNNGQTGAVALITPRNQDGTTPWATVTDVLFQTNVLRNAGAGFQIQGDDNEHPSARATRIQIVSNLLYNIDAKAWKDPLNTENASGRLFQLTRGPANVTIDRNTIVGANLNSFLVLDGPALADHLVITNNVLPEGKYAINASPKFGVDAWTAWVTNGTLDGNLIARTGLGATVKYPAGANVISGTGEVVTDAAFAVIAKYAREGLGVPLAQLPITP